ncbi:MAG TPA: hypothetical protein VD993_12250 [Chitinophagaceae bacterium]|nr:hypothetical protein [Chitinophagaceae bacterium]
MGKFVLYFVALFCASGAVAQEDMEKLLAKLTDTLSKDPQNVQILVLRGMLYAESKQCDKAVADFTSSLSYIPGFRKTGRPADSYDEELLDSNTILRMRAYCYDQMDSVEKSVADYQLLQSLQPDEFFLSIAVARIYIQREMYDRAQAEIDRIKNNRGTNERGLVYQAILYYESEKYQQALEAVETTLDNHPNSIEGMMTKAKILAKLSKQQEACKLLDEAASKISLGYFKGERGYLREFEKDIQDLKAAHCK